MFDHRHLAAALESVSSVPAEPVTAGIDVDGLAHHDLGTHRYADPRRRIFDAMIETVARRGYDLTTIERVASVAGVPTAVFDEHFEDKRECFLRTLDELIARLESTVVARVNEQLPWPERIEVGLRALLTELAAHPDSSRVAMVECLSAGDAAIARLHRLMARLAGILDEGRAHASEHEADADWVEYLPPQISTAVVGGIVSIVHRRVLEDRTDELGAMLGDLLYFALLPYLGHDRALSIAGLGAEA